MLKKFIIGTLAIVAIAGAITVSAADFGKTTLKVGSKGEAVKALQTLVGVKADGVFGKNTEASVKAWQANHGLTADGKFGLKSMAIANGSTTTTTTTTTTTPTDTTVVTGTTDGSITASTSSYVSSGITVKKGETKDVAAVRLQATAGPVKINRVDVTFNVRPWLFFSQVALHDSTGKVLATKTLSSIADTTELTVGTSYMVRFEGVDYTVTPGTNPDLAVSASVLAATDKINGTQSVTTAFTGFKTVSEVGYVSTVAPVSGGSNTVTLSSTASTALINARISPNSPLTGQQVVNATNTTSDVTLGIFSVKSTNNSSTLNTLAVNMTGTATDTIAFSNFRLYVGGVSVAGGTLSGDNGIVTFSNLTTPLALDTWTDLTIKADIAANVSGTVAISLINDATHVVVTDANYGTPATADGLTRTTNYLTLTQNSVTVSGIAATLGSAIVQANVTTGYNATYAFTLTNNSNNDLFVSATPSTFVTSTTTPTTGTAATSALTSVSLAPSTVSGDDASGAYYSIPAGTARTFTFAAALRGVSGSATVLKATQINYGITTGALSAYNIATGLSGLSLTASF